MKIRTNEKEVIESGVAISDGMNPIEFIISEVPKFVVKVTVDNTTNQEHAQLKLHTSIADTIEFQFINPDKTLNLGPSELLKIGALNGREIFVSFRMQTFGTDNKTFSYAIMYSFYLGKSI